MVWPLRYVEKVERDPVMAPAAGGSEPQDAPAMRVTVAAGPDGDPSSYATDMDGSFSLLIIPVLICIGLIIFALLPAVG